MTRHHDCAEPTQFPDDVFRAASRLRAIAAAGLVVLLLTLTVAGIAFG
ncbi:hypothetical protein JOD54_002139 [Actinokineospora baliensis]|nr:hypothetical protein [Actinokineospora baliensis]